MPVERPRGLEEEHTKGRQIVLTGTTTMTIGHTPLEKTIPPEGWLGKTDKRPEWGHMTAVIGEQSWGQR